MIKHVLIGLMLVSLAKGWPCIATREAVALLRPGEAGVVPDTTTDGLEGLLEQHVLFAAQGDTTDWKQLLSAKIPRPMTTPAWRHVTATLDSLESTMQLTADSTPCLRWKSWQLSRCRIDLAAAQYDSAVQRSMTLMNDGPACLDDQAIWWDLALAEDAHLTHVGRKADRVMFLEAVLRTFPSGPARHMRSEVVRLKWELGTLDWDSTLTGVLGVGEVDGIALHHRYFIADTGDTLRFPVDASVVITLDGKIWRPHLGLLPADSTGRAASGDPLRPGNRARIYSRDGRTVMIEVLQ